MLIFSLLGSLSNSLWSFSTRLSSSRFSTSYPLWPKANFAKGLRTLPANLNSPSNTCTKSMDLSAAPIVMRTSSVFHGYVYQRFRRRASKLTPFFFFFSFGCRANTSSSLTLSSNKPSLKRSRPSWVSFHLAEFCVHSTFLSRSPRTRPLVLPSPH